MKLEECGDCGEMIPEDAKCCPTCGRNIPFERKLFRSLVLTTILFVVVVAAALAFVKLL